MTFSHDDTEQPLGLIDLRPMDVGDILDGTIRVYRRNPWTFISILAAIIGIPFFIAEIPNTIQRQMLIDTVLPMLLKGQFNDMLAAYQQPGGNIREYVLIITGIVMFFLSPIAQAAMVHAVSETILGREPSFAGSLRAIKAKIGRIIWAYFLLVFIMIGLLLPILVSSIIAAISPENIVLALAFLPLFPVSMFLMFYFMVKYIFIPQAVVLDNATAAQSLKRSFRLTGGYWWRTFGIYLLISILVMVIVGLLGQTATIMQAILNKIPQMSKMATIALGSAIVTVIQLMIGPITSIATTLMYYDLRIRKEGFDVILLASSLIGAFGKKEEPQPEVPLG